MERLTRWFLGSSKPANQRMEISRNESTNFLNFISLGGTSECVSKCAGGFGGSLRVCPVRVTPFKFHALSVCRFPSALHTALD